MPIITLPDSTELEFPDNPTSEDKAFLKKLILKFEGQNDPTKKFNKDFKPKAQDQTGFEQTKTNNNVLDSLKLGWNEIQKQGQRGLDLFEGGVASLLGNTEDISAIEARAKARNAQINETNQNILKGQQQGIGGQIMSGLVQAPAYIPHPGNLPTLGAMVAGKFQNTTDEQMAQGVDQSTARQSGAIAGGADALMSILPGAVGVKPLLGRIASGVGIGAGSVAAGQEAIHQNLKFNKYDEQAKAYEFDPEHLTAPGVIGAVAGAFTKAKIKPSKKPSSLVDELNALKEQETVVKEQEVKNSMGPDPKGLIEQLIKESDNQLKLKQHVKTPLKTGNQLRQSFGNRQLDESGSPLALDYQINKRDGSNQVDVAQRQVEADALVRNEQLQAARLAEEQRQQNLPGEIAQQQIDNQPFQGNEYDPNPAGKAELESFNTLQRPPSLSPEMTERFGTENPSGVVNPKAVERVNQMSGADSQMTQAQHEAYGGDLAGTGIVNPKALDVINEPSRPLDLFAEQGVKDSAEVKAFQQAVAAANKTADKIAPRVLGGVGKRGRNQGGAIDFSSFLGKKTTPDQTVRKTSDPNAVKKGPLDDFITARSYDDVKKLELERPDHDPSSSKIGRQLRPGIALEAVIQDSPIMGAAYNNVVKAAGNAGDNIIKQYVTGDGAKDYGGTIDYWHKQMRKGGDPNSFNEAMQVMITASNNKMDIPPSIMAKMSPEQQGMISGFRAVFDDLFDKMNEARKTEKKEPLPKVPGYFPGLFPDAYKGLVRKNTGKVDAKGNPIYKTELMLGSNTKLGYNKLAEQYSDKSIYDIEKMPDRRLSEQTTAFERQQGFSTYLEMIEKRDPLLAQDLRDVFEANTINDTRVLFGMDKHELGKKGIGGTAGNKPWKTPEQNAKEGYEAALDFIKDAAEYYEYKTQRQKFDEKVKYDPQLAKLKPKSIAEAEKYFANYEGKNGHLGAFINEQISDVITGLGIAPKHIQEPSAATQKLTSQLMIGTLQPAFVAQQLTQMLTSHIPFLDLVKGRVGANAADITASVGRSGLATTSLLVEHFTGVDNHFANAFEKSAFKYAKDNQIVAFSEMENIKKAQQNPYMRKYDNFMEAGPRLGEYATRPTSFMSFATLINNIYGDHYTPAQIFDISRQLTQISMINYERAERPFLYNQLGMMGQFTGKFKTYGHGYLGQQRVLWKEATKGYQGEKNTNPLSLSAGSALLLGGVLALPAVEAADSMLAYLTDLAGHRISVKKIVMENLGLALAVGLVSEYTGLALTSKFSNADIVPKNPVEWAAGAVGTKMGSIVTSTFELLAKGDKQAVDQFLGTIAPPGHITEALRYHRYNDNGMLLDKKKRNDIYRTPEQWKQSRLTGIRPLTEMVEKEGTRLGTQDSQFKVRRLKELETEYHRLIKNNVDKDSPRWKSIIKAYEVYGGSAEGMAKAVDKLNLDFAKTSKQRAEGIEWSTPAQVQRYNDVNSVERNRPK